MGDTPLPNPPTDPDGDRSSRTVRRIVMETLFIGLLGALLLGMFWEMGYPTAGWIVAAAIWILGDPFLELSRLKARRDVSKR